MDANIRSLTACEGMDEGAGEGVGEDVEWKVDDGEGVWLVT